MHSLLFKAIGFLQNVNIQKIMKKFSCAIFFVFLILAAPTRAEKHDIVGGAGAFTCTDFAKEYDKDPLSEVTFFTWAQGFMSGLNAVAETGKARDLASQPFIQQQSFIRTYCKLNPDSSYAVGVSELYATLQLNR
jgi:hypothetical protein